MFDEFLQFWMLSKTAAESFLVANDMSKLRATVWSVHAYAAASVSILEKSMGNRPECLKRIIYPAKKSIAK